MSSALAARNRAASAVYQEIERATGLGAAFGFPPPLEVFNDVFRQADPRPAAVDAMRSLVALRESVGVLEVPEAPRLGGHAFAELAVPGAVLADLGFAHVGTHRSKPVQLWQQGSARLLVNETAADGAACGNVARPRAAPRARPRRGGPFRRRRAGRHRDLLLRRR